MKIEFHIFHHQVLDSELKALLSELIQSNNALSEKVDTMNQKQDELTAAVDSLGVTISDTVNLLGELHTELSAAMAANDPVALQASIDKLGNLKATLSAANSANAPVAPASDPTPPADPNAPPA